MQNDFKLAMSNFATGVCVVVYNDLDSKDVRGITISSFSSVSLSPLKVLFCLSNLGKSHKSFSKIVKFSINILNSEQEYLAYKFSGQEMDDTEYSFLDIDNVPCISNSLATIICTKGNVYEEGDHNIVIGEVDDIVLDYDVQSQPLLYFKSKIITDCNISSVLND